MVLRILIGSAFIATLAACASGPKISAEDCAAADWYAVGLQHGKVGANITEINTAVQACGETGNPVDIGRYSEGRAEGLKTFCTPLTILESATQGKGDPYSCDPMTPALKASIDKGVETRAAMARYQQYQAQYKQLIDQRNQYRTAEAEWQRRLSIPKDRPGHINELSDPSRSDIILQLKTLGQKLSSLNDSISKAIPVMQKEKQTYDAAVQSYNAYKAGLGGSN